MLSSIGFLYGILSALSYGVMSFLVHWNPNHVPSDELAFLRGIVSFFLLLPFCYFEIPSYFRSGSLSLWMRSITGALGLLCYYYVLQGTVSANANLMYSSSPVFVSLLSFFLFGDRLTKLEFAGIALVVLGNIFLYIPNQASISSQIWIVGLLGAFLASIAFLSLGQATKKYSATLIVLGLSFATILICPLASSKNWAVPSGAEAWAFVIAVSLLGLFSQLTATGSFAHLKSSVATAIGRTSILFSGVLDIWIAKYRPHTLEIVSYFVVFAGIVIVHVYREKKS